MAELEPRSTSCSELRFCDAQFNGTGPSPVYMQLETSECFGCFKGEKSASPEHPHLIASARSANSCINHAWRRTMTSLKTFAVAALLSVTAATPVLAQAAIQEPGLFAFYHPNLDVLNGGAPTPAAALASDPAAMEAFAARESGIAPPQELSAPRPGLRHFHRS